MKFIDDFLNGRESFLGIVNRINYGLNTIVVHSVDESLHAKMVEANEKICTKQMKKYVQSSSDSL